MTSEELLALLKSGKNEFYELDIEGIFINENLSNLFFEKCFFVADFSGANLTKTVFDGCNLKTCDFSYCNLEGSIFENNCLDATEFKFVQFKNITFKNNSAYGCEFTKELLEDMQYDNYPGFHISTVKAGWFDVILSDRAKNITVTASDYLCNDAPYEFLIVINDLCSVNSADISKTKWLCWDEEPGAYIWKLERQDEIITIGVYTAKRDSYDISPQDRQHLDREEIYCTDFETTGDFHGFIREVADSYEKIKSLKREDKNYEKQWGGFPDIELSKLKSYIQTVKQKNKQ